MRTFSYKTLGNPQSGSYVDAVKRHYCAVLEAYNKEFKTNFTLSIESHGSGVLTNCYTYTISVKSIIESYDTTVAHVTYTGMNNCCGASSIQALHTSDKSRSIGLGQIIMCIVEDLAKGEKKSSIACTEIIRTATEADITGTIDLSKYTAVRFSHKILDKNNYKLVDAFINIKTNNVVGYFIKTITDHFSGRSITINVQDMKEKFVKIERFTIGGDPEGFFRDPKTGEFVPSFMIMGGTKENPEPITEEGHAIQCDNVMFEYNIPPSDNVDDFVKHNLFVQNYLKDKVAGPRGLELAIIASARFNPNNLKADKALEMGCSPDYNAYTGAANVIDDKLIKSNLRTAGGHVAIGYANHNFNSNRELVKYLDMYVSVPLQLMEPDSERKKLYGKAGAFRHTPFGLEYRVTSNFVYSSEEMMRWLYGAISQAIAAYNAKINIQDYVNYSIDAISNKSSESARMLVKRYDLNVFQKQTV